MTISEADKKRNDRTKKWKYRRTKIEGETINAICIK